MIRVLIVDDHTIFREGLKKVLSTTSDVEVAGESGDGCEALRLIMENAYDVVLLDLALPGMQGLDVLRTVKDRKVSLPVLVLSIYPEEQYAVRVLREGAAGYLTKESVPSDLIRAIRRAAQGGPIRKRHPRRTTGRARHRREGKTTARDPFEQGIPGFSDDGLREERQGDSERPFPGPYDYQQLSSQDIAQTQHQDQCGAGPLCPRAQSRVMNRTEALPFYL